MFYFNTELRVTYFPHASPAEGMDHCYDCSAEIFVLCQYLNSRGLTEPVSQQEAGTAWLRRVFLVNRFYSFFWPLRCLHTG